MALPGRFGTLIWTVLVTWMRAWNKKRRKYLRIPHLLTIWTRSIACAQTLLSAVEKNKSIFGNKDSKKGFLVWPWTQACWSSSPCGSRWTLSGPRRGWQDHWHWSLGSLLQIEGSFQNLCELFTRRTVGLVQSLFLLCYPSCGIVHPVPCHSKIW